MSLEDVLSSRLRIKILKILSKMGELNVSEIARRLGVNYNTTSQHLRILENEGIVKHKLFGRIRLYRLNEQSPKARALQNLLESWEHPNKY
ncbi:MAG: ArsR/SmtB family transcription factor [Candidatus Bathyarchaeia archaeon]|nr:MAG: ArsR family transcriptional regulator [Candidatus Bathyarchaeota archaeon]